MKRKIIKNNSANSARWSVGLSIILSIIMVLNAGLVFAEEDEYYEDSYGEESYEEASEDYSEEYYEEPSEDYYQEESSEDYYDESTDGYSGEYYEELPEDSSDGESEDEEGNEEGSGKSYVDTSKPPVLASSSAAIYCRNTGEIVLSRYIDKRVLPYSVTKLLTAFLAVQKLPMNQKVIISAEAVEQGGASMELLEGEEVTVEELLYGTLVLSGNDAAYALGEAVAGSGEAFVNLMNETASNMGCKNTHFANPHGLSTDINEHYTTAGDMMSICKLAFANDTVRSIAGTLKYEMPMTNLSDVRVMESHNKLLMDKVPGFVSGKTGWIDEDHASLAMDYEKDGVEFIVVLFGVNEDARWDDCENMVKYASANIKGEDVFPKGEIIGKVRVRHGAETRVDAVTERACEIYLPKAASKELIRCEATMYNDVTAPLREGDVVGKYQVYVANELVDEVNLIAAYAIKEGWLPSYVGISNQATLIGGGLIAMLVLVIILRIITGIRRKHQRKKAHRAKVRALARKQLEEERKEFESQRGRFYR